MLREYDLRTIQDRFQRATRRYECDGIRTQGLVGLFRAALAMAQKDSQGRLLSKVSSMGP